jgi:hypothetical protein
LLPVVIGSSVQDPPPPDSAIVGAVATSQNTVKPSHIVSPASTPDGIVPAALAAVLADQVVPVLKVVTRAPPPG